jgi:hypothetical protein
MHSPLTEYNPELEAFAGDRFGWPDTSRAEIFSETGEMDLAAELLAVRDEQELEQFLSDLVPALASRIGSAVPPQVGQAIGRILSGVLKKVVARAGPAATLPDGSLGAAIGSGLASMAGEMLGWELEGLSHEDQEFAAARRFVRFASEAVNNAASMPASDQPAEAAHAAIVATARRLAPGLTRFLRPPRADQTDGALWVRQAPPNHRQTSITRPTPTTYDPLTEATMHDIDRTQLETMFESEGESFEYEQYEWPGESGTVLSEDEVMELAAELMEVRDEQELDRFLSDALKRASRALGPVVSSPLGQAVGGMLKGVAKKALPLAGTAVGTWLGGPLGAKIGSGLATMAGNALGLEGESWSQEDREYEGAKQFVRLAADSVKNAAQMGPGVDPRAAAQASVAQAARTLAPGLLQSSAPLAQTWRRDMAANGNSGLWRRRGNRIVLYGV